MLYTTYIPSVTVRAMIVICVWSANTRSIHVSITGSFVGCQGVKQHYWRKNMLKFIKSDIFRAVAEWLQSLIFNLSLIFF